MMLIFCVVHANDSLGKTNLSQLYDIHDSSIRELKHEKFYLNPERISVSENGILLQSECLGAISLQSLFQDNEGMYTMGLWRIYQCNGCPRQYNSPPAKCVCGSTSFTPIDLLPD